MRLTDFWDRMTSHFGSDHVRSVAENQVIPALGDRTILEAIDAGIDTKTIWKAVCDTFDVPYSLI